MFLHVLLIIVWLLSTFVSLFVFLPDIYYVFLSRITIVCLLLIEVVYCRIYVVLRRHQIQIQALQEGQVLRLRFISYLLYAIPYFCAYLSKLRSNYY